MRVPDSMKSTFKEYFPIRKPLSFNSVSSRWNDQFRSTRREVEGLGASLHGFHTKEVRGKYSRPIESINGLYSLRQSLQTGDKSTTRRSRYQETTEASPVSPNKPKSASQSPRKLPSEYIAQLQTQLNQEKQRRSEVESRIKAIATAA